MLGVEWKEAVRFYEGIPLLNIAVCGIQPYIIYASEILFEQVDGLCSSEIFNVQIVLGKTVLLKSRSCSIWNGMPLIYNGDYSASGNGAKDGMLKQVIKRMR